MPKSSVFSSVLWLALASLWGNAAADVYKWVDDRGQVVYSQSPPPPPKHSVRIKTVPGPDPAEIARAQQALQQSIEQGYDQEEKKRHARTQKEQQKEMQDMRAKNCEIARKNLNTIQNLGRRRVISPDGTPVFLSEEERAARIEKAQKNIQEYCD